eukprot:6234260-Ditylum_brightwellii.AAC.1
MTCYICWKSEADQDHCYYYYNDKHPNSNFYSLQNDLKKTNLDGNITVAQTKSPVQASGIGHKESKEDAAHTKG